MKAPGDPTLEKLKNVISWFRAFACTFALYRYFAGFTDRNATTFMGRPSMYIDFVKEAGMKYVTWWDGSFHLERYFRDMLSQIKNNRPEMNAKGITDQYLDNWVSSLTERADIQKEKGVFAWGVFVARKPFDGELML
jgi:sarcosine/dimethylglycine N-methyltransferase